MGLETVRMRGKPWTVKILTVVLSLENRFFVYREGFVGRGDWDWGTSVVNWHGSWAGKSMLFSGVSPPPVGIWICNHPLDGKAIPWVGTRDDGQAGSEPKE